MIKIFFGDDRIKCQSAIKTFLGENYEILDATDLTAKDLPDIFRGASLFSTKRSILIRDFSENKELWEKLGNYLETPHNIALWETKLDKRSSTYKTLSKLPKTQLDFQEYKSAPKTNPKLVFDILDTALRNGPEAIKLLERIEADQDPFMLVGLLATQAIKKYQSHPGPKEKRVLKELSKLDIELKTTPLSSQPWLLLKSFLLRASSL